MENKELFDNFIYFILAMGIKEQNLYFKWNTNYRNRWPVSW